MLLDLDKKLTDSVAVIDSSLSLLTYGDIINFGDRISSMMKSRSLIFMLCRNDAGAVAWSIGMLLNKIVPLMLNAQTDLSLLENLITTYQPEYICLPEDDFPEMKGTEVACLKGYRLLKTNASRCNMYVELSHLLPTSGSTGSPKLVRHCYRNIEAAGLNISTFFKLKPGDRALMVLPLYYTMGLSMVFSHFKAGATILITDISMTDPKFWDFLKSQHATSFTGVPYSFDILNMMRFFRMQLPDLKLLTQGGGRMERGLNLKFAEYCRDNGMKWIATYGQTEGSARMAYLPPEYAIDKVGSIGWAVPNGKLSLVDDTGKIIEEPNVEGEMCYQGENVTLGYACCRADLGLGDERNGFMRTGDLAYRDDDGCYYIVGRLGRFLKLYGMRVGLDECERIVKAKFETECACLGNDSQMTIFVTKEGIEQSVVRELVRKTSLVAKVFVVKYIKELPKSGAGKILYSKLKEIEL